MSVQNAIEITGDQTAVYRLYDRSGKLLYVGITRDIDKRFARHAAEKYWWPQVARKTAVLYGSRGQARLAETGAIAAESPLHNIAGAPSEPELPAGDTRFHHARMVRHLKARIRTGDLAPGQKLPTAAELQFGYRVAAITVSRALGVLQKKGLIERRNGWFAVKVRHIAAPKADSAPKSVRAPKSRHFTAVTLAGRRYEVPVIPVSMPQLKGAHSPARGAWSGVTLRLTRT